MKSWFFLLILLMPFTLTECYYDKEDLLYPANCVTTPAHFTDVKPIILSKCSTPGCHNTAAAGGVVLETYSQISSYANRINQRAIIDKTMPPASPLSAAETNTLRCWINSGTPNN